MTGFGSNETRVTGGRGGGEGSGEDTDVPSGLLFFLHSEQSAAEHGTRRDGAGDGNGIGPCMDDGVCGREIHGLCWYPVKLSPFRLVVTGE